MLSTKQSRQPNGYNSFIMAITIDCPRCYSALSVPEKLAGTYTFCPRCQGRMWVPPETSARASTGRTATTTAPTATVTASGTLPPATPPASVADAAVDPMAPVKVSPSGTATASTVLSKLPPIPTVPVGGAVPIQAPPSTAPPVAATPRRVAQFITADVAQSQLTVAEDGKLPELQLTADEAGPRKRKVFSGGNSWATVALVIVSAIATVAMLVVDVGPDPSAVKESDSYKRLNDSYVNAADVEARPYQTLLRLALEAHARHDYKAEKQYYRQVLGMLRDENLHPRGRNLTGQIIIADDPNLPSDKDLEEHLSKLLGER